LTHFFRLTSAFFGLTSEYKSTLLEEIYIFTQHLDGFTHADVLNLPVYERRFFLSLKSKEINKRNEYHEEQSEQNSVVNNGKGNKQRKISGNALKSQIKTGNLPIN